EARPLPQLREDPGPLRQGAPDDALPVSGRDGPGRRQHSGRNEQGARDARIQEARDGRARGPFPAEDRAMSRAFFAMVALATLGSFALAQQPASQPTTRRAEPTVLLGSPVELKDKVDVAILAEKDPRLLVIKGRRTGVANAVFEINGATWGTAAGFAAGTEK